MATAFARADGHSDPGSSASCWPQGKYGLSLAGYVFVARPRAGDGSLHRPLVIKSFREDPESQRWARQYLRQGLFAQDPIYESCLGTTLPVWWRTDRGAEVIVGQARRCMASQVDTIRRCVSETGVKGGVTVPLHSSVGGFGYVAFIATSDLAQAMAQREAVEDAILGFAHRLHEEMRASAATENTDGVHLSERELECLRLISHGKSLFEIADILGLSYSTVRFHLRRAAEKLGVAERVHAAAKAAYIGLLGPIH